jgi:hypothetical protein
VCAAVQLLKTCQYRYFFGGAMRYELLTMDRESNRWSWSKAVGVDLHNALFLHLCLQAKIDPSGIDATLLMQHIREVKIETVGKAIFVRHDDGADVICVANSKEAAALAVVNLLVEKSAGL